MTKLQLFEVRDVHGFAAAIARQGGLNLSRADHDDLVAFLVSESWRLSLAYDPGGREPRFGAYLKQRLAMRRVDWIRARYGRSRQWRDGRVVERPPLHLVSLDGGENPLADALEAPGSDPALGRNPDLAGLLDAGDRERARDLAELGLGSAG